MRVRLSRRGDTVDVSIEREPVGYCVKAAWGPVWFAYDLLGRTIQGRGGTGVHEGLHGAARAVLTKSRRTEAVRQWLRELRAA